MSIRCSAKALIFHEGRILLNQCADEDGVYYDLPGGGQDLFEPLEDAVVREVMEETGYAVEVGRFAALAEEICVDPVQRRDDPDYCHRMQHIFEVRLLDVPRQTPTGFDRGMKTSVWMTVEELKRQERVYPPSLPARIEEIMNSDGAIWLGTVMRP